MYVCVCVCNKCSHMHTHSFSPSLPSTALVKYLDDIPESEIVELNIPTGIPLVYELDAETLKVLSFFHSHSFPPSLCPISPSLSFFLSFSHTHIFSFCFSFA